MDETSYSDPRVIAAVNEHFVPVRVDNDRHPDVNRRYNMGGWPTTAFLAASGDVLTGGTYLPPDQMLESLARVKAFFDANQAEIIALAGERAERRGRRRDGQAHRHAAERRTGRWRRPRRARRHPGRGGVLQMVRGFDHGAAAASAPTPSSRSRTFSRSCSPSWSCAAPAPRASRLTPAPR